MVSYPYSAQLRKGVDCILNFGFFYIRDCVYLQICQRLIRTDVSFSEKLSYHNANEDSMTFSIDKYKLTFSVDFPWLFEQISSFSSAPPGFLIEGDTHWQRAVTSSALGQGEAVLRRCRTQIFKLEKFIEK